MASSRKEFPAKVRVAAAERAGGKCQSCSMPFAGKPMHFDHILPDALGGQPILANCQVLCEPCHKIKTAKEDVPRIRKADRQKRKALGIKKEGPKIENKGFPKYAKQKKEPIALPPRRSLYVDK